MNNQFDELARAPVQSGPWCGAPKKFFLCLAFASSSLAYAAMGASLSGRALEDLTGNGVSADDKPVQGRVVRLFRDNGDSVFNAATDTLVLSATTGRDGAYTFRNLPAGSYFVQQVLPAFWVQTAPAPAQLDDI